jgi:hypothetical protein
MRARATFACALVVRLGAHTPETAPPLSRAAFFQRWWDEQEDQMQDLVRGLVANGQLEFINGALARSLARPRALSHARACAFACALCL